MNHAVDTHLKSDFQSSVQRLCQWLAIPSVSTNPAHADDCRNAARWLADDVATIGFDAQLCETDGHPIVLAHHSGPIGSTGPHILFYGHYDVQPPDPLDLWNAPPFEPALVKGEHGDRVVARGAADDKGQVMTFVEACRAWHTAGGGVPCPITMVIEGEEECGSTSLPKFLKEHKETLVGPGATTRPCTMALVSDTDMWDIKTPAITYGLRGLVYLEVTLHGPKRDLHSGQYGGCVANPINELTQILGQIHDADRRITIPDFYDDVLALTDEERARWRELGFDEQAFLNEAGFTQSRGEKGYSVLERQWARPTCDINGIVGGYTGYGAKTVITTEVTAKVSFRLVPQQEPARIIAGFKQWLEALTPRGCRVEIKEFGTGRPLLAPLDHPAMNAAREGLRAVMDREPAMIRGGGSIPIIEGFKSILGLDTLLIGFGLGDDRVHSPNEKFELTCFSNGQRCHAAMLDQFAAMVK